MMTGIEKSSPVAKDGSFDVGGLAPGSWNLVLMRMDNMIQTLSIVPLEVGNEDVGGVSVTAVQPVDVQGVIRIEGAKSETPKPDPAKGGQATRPGMRVSLQPNGGGVLFGAPANAIAKDDGSFTLQHVGAGGWRVMVAGLPQGGYLKSVKLGGREELASGIDFAQGAAGALEIVISPEGGEVSGTVKDHDGNPASGFATLIPEAGSESRPDLYRTSGVSENGEFRLRGVAPGKYRVYSLAESDMGQQFDPDFLKLHEKEVHLVTVEESATQQVNLVR